MGAAALRRHVSPSAISLAISDLEQILDAPRLLRVPHRPLALTAPGRAIVGDLRRLVNPSEDLVDKPAARPRRGCSTASTSGKRSRPGSWFSPNPTCCSRATIGSPTARASTWLISVAIRWSCSTSHRASGTSPTSSTDLASNRTSSTDRQHGNAPLARRPKPRLVDADNPPDHQRFLRTPTIAIGGDHQSARLNAHRRGVADGHTDLGLPWHLATARCR